MPYYLEENPPITQQEARDILVKSFNDLWKVSGEVVFPENPDSVIYQRDKSFGIKEGFTFRYLISIAYHITIPAKTT